MFHLRKRIGTKINEWPPDSGKPVIKSKKTWLQGRLGIGNGLNRLEGGHSEFLLRAETKHATANSFTSLSIAGHQNQQEIESLVHCIPGLPVSLDEWPHCNTWEQTPTSTNKQVGGTRLQVLGLLGSASIFHKTQFYSQFNFRSTILLTGTTVSNLSSGSQWSNIRDRASGLVYLDPGR